MNILHIASADFAGVAMALVNAINRYSSHKARLVTGRRHSLGFQTDIVAHKDVSVVQKWLKWADLVNTYNHYGMLDRAEIKPKRLIITHSGSTYRRSWKKLNIIDANRGAFQLCTTPDLAVRGATWLPTAIPVEPYLKMARAARKKNVGPPVVCQAPSDLIRKNTKEAAALVKSLGDRVRWRCIVKKQHPECLRLKLPTTIGIDQFIMGLGVNGYEFLAMGVPVIAHAIPWAEKAIIDAIGYLPYVDAKVKNVARAIVLLLDDPDFYEESAARGLAYVRKFHARPNVVDRYLAVCEKVMRR